MSEVATEKGTFIETTMLSVQRTLTDAELGEIARKAALCEFAAGKSESDAEAARADATAAKKEAEARLEEAREYLQMVARGVCFEEVECGVISDFASNRLGYIRLDTGEVVEVRAMYGDERAQMSIGDLVAPPPTPEQIAALEAYELEHGRIAHRGAIADDVDEDDA